ncbi:MAG TPA: prephenate dehydrogenase/arogenate dehydrogenase family protein [Clostridia bacterium]|nr:prephenate dehydrogenase/arogenate dehydrogenase family protein [Clostridia bacterium]
MRIAILGFGLIGGSIARALAVAPDRAAWSVAAWSPTGHGPARAAADGTVAEAAPDSETAIAGAHLVVIAAPPTATLDLLDRLGGPLRTALSGAAVVTDVASTKSVIVDTARRHGLRFVGGHPMAGRETSGYAAALPDLFAGRPWVVVPADPSDAQATLTVETLVVACGARPVRLDAGEHDRAVAAISHLPLVLAAALVEAVAGSPEGAEPESWPLARTLASSGWRDMTRLARGDVAMGAGIATTNAPELASRIRAVRSVLDGWLEELERQDGPNERRLAARLQAARDRLETDRPA